MNKLLSDALKLSPSERYKLAFLIAESIGFSLKKEIDFTFKELSKEEILEKWPTENNY